MQYRDFGKTGLKISALGFGSMRLPEKDGHVEVDKAVEMIHRAFELGVNYIDSAYFYNHHESEVVVGKALKGWRDKVTLSTKNPDSSAPADKWREILDEQMKKLDVDRIDVYHFHGINWWSFENEITKPGGALEAARKAQDEGLFTHLSFSFHDTPENLVKLVDTGEFTSVTCQYNLLDRANEPSIAHAHEKGMGVVIMGPVGGGRLGAPTPGIRDLLPAGSVSSAEIALRFVLSNPHVSCAISGMENTQMVEENCATASRGEPLSEEERAQILAALEEKKKLADLYCTGCGYCMPCPHGVDIPGNFQLMNTYRLYGLLEHAQSEYREEDLARNKAQAAYCQECGECEPKCPQKISIIAQLKETDAALGKEAAKGE
ncbi:MAG: aldo/keto reductase [Armatimonadetes bacterium]|nr:aldo/keto reductase [Armatimonadota bacterium]